MAAIFQIRRGTSGSKPTLLAEGELYVDQSSENLIIGVSGSKEITLLKLNDINTGSLHLTGDIRLSGSIYLGNETADNISALGVFTTNLVPSGDSTKDVGTSGSYWRNLYATNISGAIAATNGVISGSSQLDTAFEQIASSTHTLVSGSSQIIGILDSLNTFSGSQLTQNTALATITGSLISTASANTISISNLNIFTQSQSTKNSDLASYTGSVESRFTQIGVVSGSLILTASNHEVRLDEIESYTSSLKTAIGISGNNVTIAGDLIVNGTTTQINSTQVNIGDNILELNFGGSATEAGIYTKDGTGLSNISGSLLWDSSTDYWKAGIKGVESKILLAGGDSILSSSLQLTELNNATASLNSFTASASGRLGNLESKSASIDVSVSYLNTFTSSQLTQNSTLGSYTASIEGRLSTIGTYTGSVETRFTEIGIVSGALILTASQHEQRIDELESKSASVDISITHINTFTQSVNDKFGTLATYTGSVNTDLGKLHESTASLNSWTASASQSIWDLYSSSINHEGRIDYIEGVAFGGLDLNAQFTTIGLVTGSLQAFTASANSRLDNLELTSQSLNSWSSSLTNTFATDAEVAAGYEAQGRGIISGSSQLSGTTITNLTITNLTTVNQTSSVVFSSGSNRFGDFGNDTHEFTGSVQISGSQNVIGNISATSFSGIINATNGVISSSAQISTLFEPIADATHTLVSGSSQIDATATTNWANGIKTQLNTNTVISGSSQVVGILSSLNSFTSSIDTTIKTKLNVDGVLSGSIQVLGATNIVSASTDSNTIDFAITNGNITANLIGGVVSGSSQVVGILSELNSFTSSINTTIKTKLNVDGVISGSSQVVGILSSLNSFTSSIDTTIKTKLNVDGVISGSIQILGGSSIHSSSVGNYQFNSIGVGLAATGVAGEIVASADIVAFSSSDIRLKENIVPIPNALEKVNQISGNTYDWKEGYDEIHSHTGNDVGVIAQEIEQILPQIVTNRDNGYKAVQYEKMIPLLIEAIKELSAKVDRLENK